jgi:hypothetical protein
MIAGDMRWQRIPKSNSSQAESAFVVLRVLRTASREGTKGAKNAKEKLCFKQGFASISLGKARKPAVPFRTGITRPARLLRET